MSNGSNKKALTPQARDWLWEGKHTLHSLRGALDSGQAGSGLDGGALTAEKWEKFCSQIYKFPDGARR